MKEYYEMAQSVLERRDKYMVKKRRERKQIAATMSCCFVCALLGVGAWKYSLPNALNSKGDDGVGLIGAESVGTDAESTGFGVEESTIGTDADGSEVTSGGKVQIETEETVPGNTTNSVHGENVEESQKEMMQQEIVGVENYEQGKESQEAVQGNDMPLQSEAGDTGTLKPFEEVWGGSYMNAQGNWVVWLTEDTTANREEVFKRNPGLSKSSTEFKKAEYTLAYLTQLMADISEAMGNDTLSFVSTAALREDLNRVEVSMSVDSEEAKQKVLAYDKLGGAIVIRTGVANGSKEIFTEELRGEVQKGPPQMILTSQAHLDK